MNKINEKNRYNESMMGILLFFILQTLALDKLKYLLDLPDQQRKFSYNSPKNRNFGLALFSRDEKSGDYKLNGHMDMSTMMYID